MNDDLSIVLTPDEEKLFYKNSDPYYLFMYINELLQSNQKERAIELLKFAYKTKKEMVEIRQQRLKVLENTSSKSILKREKTYLEREEFYLKKYETYYQEITGRLIKKTNKTK